MFNKPLVSQNVKIEAVLPEQHIEVPLTIQVVPTPKRREPLSDTQKKIIWIVLGVMALIAWTILTVWFASTQIAITPIH